MRTTLRGVVADGLKKFAIDLVVKGLTAAWQGATFAVGALAAGAGVISYAASNGTSTSPFDIPANIQEGFGIIVSTMEVIRLAGLKYLAE